MFAQSINRAMSPLKMGIVRLITLNEVCFPNQLPVLLVISTPTEDLQPYKLLLEMSQQTRQPTNTENVNLMCFNSK